MKKKLFFLVVLLVTMVAGAWGDPVTGTVDFVAKSRSTYENGTFTTANNAGNGYALAVADLSVLEGIADATTVKLEFDVQINTNDRLYMAIGDKTVRGETANGSSKATYNTEGLMMYYGSKDGTYLYVNGTANGAAPMGVTSHVTFTFNRGKVNTYSYTITNKETSAVLFSATNQVTDVSNATIVEAYSWNNSQSSAISAVSYSYEPASEEPAEPEPTEPEGWPKVWDFSTFPSNAADYESYTSPYNYNALICVMPYSTSTKDDVVSPADYITKNGFHANGTSSASNRYMMYTPAFNGKLTVTFKSNNTSATDRITAIGTAVKTFNKNNVDAETVPTEVLAYAFTNGSEPQTVSADLTAGTKYYIYLANGGQTITKLQYDEAQVAPATFAITVADGITNGTVTVDKTEAAEGEEVTVTATPANGYELDAITVTGKTSNQAVTVTDGKFTMIADAVTVSATFKAHVHEFVLDPDQSSEPSCTEPGKKVSVCICGEKEEEEIPAHGHIIGENGICTVCGYNSNQSGTTEKGWLLTTPDKLVTGDIVVIVDQTSLKAMSNDKGTSAAPSAESVTLSEDKSSITDKTVAANIRWVVTVNEGSYQFNVKGTNNYLYVTKTNNGVRVGAGDRNAFSIKTGGENNGYYLYNYFKDDKDQEDERYVGCNNSTDWRCYTSINSNIKGNKNAFYKKVGEDAVATPEISGTTPFVGSTTVTITCETQDAAIYYTTDGTDPTDESTKYTMAFELTASATVKAIAYDVTGANSEIASKEFTVIPSVATVAELNALENKAPFNFSGEALVVAKATVTSSNSSRNYVYIKDEAGSSLIYDANASKTADAVVGKTLAANWTGKVSIYNKLFEAVPDAALSVKDGDPVEVTYPEAQLSDIKAENINQVVVLKGVTYTYTSENKKLTISIGQESTDAGYNQFGLEIAAAEEGKSYNIVGAISRYNDNIQFWPISIEEAQTKPAPLYVIGDISTGGWDRTNMTQMEFNVDTKANEYSFTIDNEFATFAIATYQMTAEEAAEDPQWSTFNAEYRWAIGDYDIDASDYVNGDAVQLVKGTTNGTVKLPKGTYIVSVDPETMMLTITGTITPKPKLEYEAVYVAGNGTEGSAWMNGVTWDPLAEANKMTKVEGKDDVWEIVFKDVPAGEDYQFKFIPSGEWSANEETKWSVNFGGDFLGYGIETPAVYNANNNIVFNTTAEKQDITLRIDLSNCAPTTDDPTTYEGATFTVIASVDKNPHVVAGCVGNNGETGAGEADLLFGTTWDGTAEANQLAYDATSKLFTKTYEAVAFEGATDIFYKIVISGWKWVPDGANLTCEIPAAGTYDITVTYNAETGEATMTATLSPEDIVINPDDITGGDITAAIAAKTEGKTVKNLTINLAEGNAYNVTSSIEAPASLTINGNGATVDASALEAAMITTPAGDLPKWKEGDLTVKDLTIKGVKKGVFASGRKNFLFNDFLVENCVIEIAATGGFEFDFRKGSVAKNFTINKSTIYAPTATTNSLYTSQSAQKATEAPGVTMQTFAITNSTLYNLAKTKNFFTHRQSNQTWLAYTVENSILANCGKSGQAIKGLNGGQGGANPTWTISGNVFNYDGQDTSAAEDTGDANEPVQNCHAGVIEFTDAANGDFNGVFTAEPVEEEPAAEEATSRRADATATLLNCGDPRWTIELKQGQTITIADDIKHGSVVADMAYAGQGTVVTITATPDENYKLERMTVEGEGVDLAIEVTMDAENPNVGTFTMPAVPVIVRAMFKYVIPAGTHILNINDIYAAAQTKTAPCENATLDKNSTTKYLLNDATIEMDIFTVVSKSNRTYRIDASTDVDYGDYESWSRLEPNGTSNSTGGRQMFIDVPEGGGVLYIGSHGSVGRTLYVTKAADKTSFVDVSNADVMLKHAFVAGEDKAADFNVYKVQLAAGLYCITQDNGIYFTYLKFVEGETYTAPTVNVDALKAEIAAAKTLLGKADITVDPGKALNTAIETATTALKSVNAETTQETVDQAVTDLQAAEDAYKLVIAKGKLTDEIATATELLGEASTEAGTPGADLKKAIDDAQAVLDNTESTVAEVNKAIEDLKTAEDAYKTATSINGVNADKYADGEWYTTGGVRVDQPTKKGLYIHNGRTVVVK